MTRRGKRNDPTPVKAIIAFVAFVGVLSFVAFTQLFPRADSISDTSHAAGGPHFSRFEMKLSPAALSSESTVEPPHQDAPPFFRKLELAFAPKTPSPGTAGHASNGIYKCMDNGKVSYTETPCKSGSLPIRNDLTSILDAPAITVTLRKNEHGLYAVGGSVNNQPTEFLIDTGATNTTLSGELAYRLGLRTCQIVGQVNTANGITGNCRVTVSILSFAGFNYSNITVNVSPNMKGASLIGNDITSTLKIAQNNGFMSISR
ncbi:MAG: retropepsin-like aspartic protease [Gallionella sp.]